MDVETKVVPSSTTVAVGNGSDVEEDSMLQKQMEVKRIFGPLQILACAVTFMSSWEAASGNLYFVFLNGGPSALSWGLIITSIGACAQAASLAEMAAMQPIAGAQYHWTAHLVHARWGRFVTWMQAWITWFAWIGVQIGVTNAVTTQIQATVLLNHPSWPAPRWQGTLMIWALTLIFSLLNIYGFRLVPWTEALTGVLHVSLWLIWSVILLVYAHKTSSFSSTTPSSSPLNPANTLSTTGFNSNHYVWFSTVDSATTSGWRSPFVAWNLGMLTSVWPYVGFDNAAHLSEEVRRAGRFVPRVMVLSIVVNAAMAWLFCLVLLYTVRSEADALEAPAGFPLAGITLGVTQSVSVTTALMVLNVVITLIAALTCVTSTSRLTWAWARDGGLPKIFSIVHPRHHVPVNAVILPCVISSLLAILNIPSTVAFQMFIALGSLGVYVSYIVAIGCMLHARWTRPLLTPGSSQTPSSNSTNTFTDTFTDTTSSSTPQVANPRDRKSQASAIETPSPAPSTTAGAEPTPPPPLHLGAWHMSPSHVGPAVNVFALLYTSYMTVWLCFPTTLPVTGVNMNYSLPIVAAVVLGAVGMWFGWARRGWKGLSGEVVKRALRED